jgi:hypothetical protein
MAGWKEMLYILMLVFIWMGGLEKEGLHGMEKREVASQSQDSLPWTAGKARQFSTRKAIKRSKFSRYLLPAVSGKSPHLLTRRPFQKVVDMPLFSCRKWRLAMRQERRRSNVRVSLIPVNWPYGEQTPNPGK